MLNLINVVINRTVERIVAMFDTLRISEVAEDAAARITNRVSDNDVLQRVARGLSESEIAEHIDLSELAQNVDLRDLAGEIDISDIAECIDVSDVASSVDMDDLARSLNYAELAGHINLAGVAKEAAEIVAAQNESPAPADGLSDPSLVERLLDRAVEKLLQMAEQAAKNEEV